MKTISPLRYGRRMVAVAVCGAALSTASMFAQDNSGSMAPQSQGEGGGPGGPGGPRGGGHMEERRLEMMTKQLNLTPDQVTQVKAIEADNRTQMRALHEDTSTAPADKRPKMMAMREASTAKVRSILTPDQQTKFDAMEARMRERMQNREGGQGGPPPPPPQ